MTMNKIGLADAVGRLINRGSPVSGKATLSQPIHHTGDPQGRW